MERIPTSLPCFPPGQIEWILDRMRVALETGALTRGPNVTAFEGEFAALTGSAHGVAVANGTAALEIILRHLDLRGGEVIVPTNTFLASANAVILAGGLPVLADIEGPSLCIGVEQIEARLTHRTRAVMAVHIAGLICPQIDAIGELCRQRGLFLIEDAAHAHGARWGERRAGALGDAAAFSFFPTKPLTTAEGGIISTDDPALADFARAWRNHGVPEGSRLHETLGANQRMDELRAIVGLSQLRTLEAMLARRREVAARYDEAFAGVEGVELIRPPEPAAHSYFKYPLLIENTGLRGGLAKALRERHGIDTGTVYWPPCHLHPVVQQRGDLYALRGPFPQAEALLPRVLCLPIHAALKEETVDRIIQAVLAELRRQ